MRPHLHLGLLPLAMFSLVNLVDPARAQTSDAELRRFLAELDVLTVSASYSQSCRSDNALNTYMTDMELTAAYHRTAQLEAALRPMSRR